MPNTIMHKSSSTLVCDEVDKDVNHNESASSPYACRTVNYNWARGEALRSKSALPQSHIL